MSARVLVCGSRDWDDRNVILDVLDGVYSNATLGHLYAEMSEFTLIDGHAPGADSVAHWWATQSPMHSHNEGPDDPHFEHLCFPADWEKYGKAAGPIRNKQMLDEGKPTVVWAFKDNFDWSALEGGSGRGTEHMVGLAKKAGIPVYVVSRA